MPRHALQAFALILALACAALAGCASMEASSAQPWATRESWEGTMSIPGLRGE